MSITRDKRCRTDLDLFVLALIDGGVATPYELRQHAGLSPGATIPALERLLQSGMVRQGKPGSRGRVEYRMTRTGAKGLATGWGGLVAEGPTGDLDVDLRVALLALWIGGDCKAATGFLKQAANHKLNRIEAREDDGEAAAPASLAEWYRKLRSASASALLRSESAAALVMAKELSKIHGRKRMKKQSK